MTRTGAVEPGPQRPRPRSGLVVPPGRGRTLRTAAQQVTFKVTGQHSRAASSFEVVVPPGFDVGAHVHTRSEELFYVLEGELELLAFEPRLRTRDGWREWESAAGDRPVRATTGTTVLVPPGCPHAFANPTGAPARMFFQAAPPPDHERYFDELLDILAADGPPDEAAVAELRARYDIEQLTPLRHGPPPGPVPKGAPDRSEEG
ncbi:MULTISPECIES: cupin domain-containing protein [Streptomyces]|uniref:Cupin n=1 Tax=Streptomyces qinglanensis TaxID=943816 RepID=A0A1E7K8Y5_9ACTN|nr:cupin domain-containing protein [Streptomyces qinglanensis]OEV00388.1 cupin [Streptomyces qinglanensis]OEV24205.1 cupin [Streptomyces nanshensis]